MNHPTSHTPASRILGLFGVLTLFSVVSFGGCTQILGIEDRTEAGGGAAGDGDGDLPEIETSDLCVEYCDEVTENCDSNKVYLAELNCLNTCNALDPGDPNEPGGNNVQCRLQAAISAGNAPSEFCISAGPGGFPGCGDNCETWCHLLESECPDDHRVLVDCEKACSTLVDRGDQLDVSTTADYQNVDNLQCRLIHLGSVGRTTGVLDESHCSHGSYIPQERCLVDPDDVDPDCDEYCRYVMGNCDERDTQVYESEEQCLAACSVMDVGEMSNTGADAGNTIGCRTYHSKAAALNPGPKIHCDHAGPTGAGTCGGLPDSDSTTGNCVSYCRYLEAGCGDAFDEAFPSIPACEVACAEDFEGNGADDGSGYEVATVTLTDNLQCRTYRAIRALEEIRKGDEADADLIAESCEKAVAPPDAPADENCADGDE